MAGSTEHDCLTVTANLVCGERHLCGAVDAHEPMRHPGHVRFAIANLVSDWILLVAIGEDLYFFAQRRREEHGLTLGVRAVEDLLDHGEESHVSHTIRLVDDGDLYVAQAHFVLIDEIQESARTCNQHVDAVAQCLALGPESHAAVHGRHRSAPDLGERLEFFTNLFCEFSRRGEDQTRRRVRSSILQTSDHGNAKGQRLAGTGRCSTKHVSALERISDCGRLNLERCVDALGRQGLDDVVGHA